MKQTEIVQALVFITEVDQNPLGDRDGILPIVLALTRYL